MSEKLVQLCRELAMNHGRYQVIMTYCNILTFSAFIPLFKWNRRYYYVKDGLLCEAVYELDPVIEQAV